MHRAAHRRGRVGGQNLAGHQPVEQMLQPGQALLDGRRGEVPPLKLDPGRDMQRLDLTDRGQPDAAAPGEEVFGRPAIGTPGVRVADPGDEEFEEAQLGRIAGGGDEGWGDGQAGWGGGDQGHGRVPWVRERGLLKTLIKDVIIDIGAR